MIRALRESPDAGWTHGFREAKHFKAQRTDTGEALKQRVFNRSQQSRNIAELINSTLTVLASTASLHYTPHSVPSRHRAVARPPLPSRQPSSSRQYPLVTSHQHPHSARSITSHARYRDNSTSDIADPHSPPTLSLPARRFLEHCPLPSIPSVCLQYCIAGN